MYVTLKKNSDSFAINSLGLVVAKTTDAVLLQLFLNLFDKRNLMVTTNPESGEKKIEILLDGDKGKMIFP